MHDGVAIVSGGMDSVVMLYKMVLQDKNKPLVVSFNYGQRHTKEIEFAREHADRLALTHFAIPMGFYGDYLDELGTTSSLVASDEAIPEGHYAEDNMRSTVVPNRNSIMINLAMGFCVAIKGHYVATGVHAGDHYQYPDCRPQFIEDTEQALLTANEGFIPGDWKLFAPWLIIPKDVIVSEAIDLFDDDKTFANVMKNTWSCYKGGEKHCGRCGTCVERAEAFWMAGAEDPTQYDDTTYWQTVSKQFKRAVADE